MSTPLPVFTVSARREFKPTSSKAFSYALSVESTSGGTHKIHCCLHLMIFCACSVAVAVGPSCNKSANASDQSSTYASQNSTYLSNVTFAMCDPAESNARLTASFRWSAALFLDAMNSAAPCAITAPITPPANVMRAGKSGLDATSTAPEAATALAVTTADATIYTPDLMYFCGLMLAPRRHWSIADVQLAVAKPRIDATKLLDEGAYITYPNDALKMSLSRLTDNAASGQTTQTIESCVAAPKERAHGGGNVVSSKSKKAAHKAVSSKKAAKPVVHKKPRQSKATRITKPSTVKKASIMNKLFKTGSKAVRNGVAAAVMAVIANTTVSISLDP